MNPASPPRIVSRTPKLESLEERLPPGDWLLGALLGTPLLLPGLLRVQADWGAEADDSGGLAANFRALVPGSSSTLLVPDASAALASAPAPLPVHVSREPSGPSAGTWLGQFPIGSNRDPAPLGPEDLFASPFADPLHASGAPGGGVTAGHIASPGGAESLSPGGGSSASLPGNGPPFSGVTGQVAAGGLDLAAPRAAGGVVNAGPATAALGAEASPGLTNAGQAGGLAPPGPRRTVRAAFDLAAPTSGPFPSDRFTVADRSQNTGRRVNLPLPDPDTQPSDYEDTQVLNTLDGFNLQPRLSIPFDGAIDVNSVNSSDIFLVSLGDTLNPHDHGGQVVGINQVVWDTFTNTLHVESDQLLDQHTRYALLVTDGVQDLHHHAVAATAAFRNFRRDLAHPHDPVLSFYREELTDAVQAARRVGVRQRDLVAASVFTTQSATAILEKIRDQIHAATPDPADFTLGLSGERTVFNRAEVTSIHWEQQTGDDPPSFTPVNLNLSLLDVIPGAVGQLAFGKYLSPDYEVHPGEYIPPVGTRTGTPEIRGYNEVYFNLFLPAGPEPPDGWPVAIYGVEGGANKNVSPMNVAASLAAQGVATLTINNVGYGFGPLGTLTVTSGAGQAVTFPDGGRGFDQNGDHVIGSIEGSVAAPPRDRLLFDRDARRQTVADFMQLVRVLQVGMDVDGDGVSDFDPNRIYYFGYSFAGFNGTLFLAVEPDVGAGVVNAAGGSQADWWRESPGNRGMIAQRLASHVPPLINQPGISIVEGVPVSGAQPYFNENMPLRDSTPLTVRLEDGTSQTIQAPVVNTVAGAMEIQGFLENMEWARQAGEATAYGVYLRKAPLQGVPAKSVIVQFGKGDQTVTNPTTTALLRAGDLADRATFYRHDLAYADDPQLPKNPHNVLRSIDNAAFRPISLEVQRQIATFFASDGTEIIHPEPARYFEVPIQGPLPEALNFIP
jgi:hypothetical protein